MMRFIDKNPDVQANKHRGSSIDKHAIEQAIADMDLIIDITIEDLQRVIQLSLNNAQKKQLSAKQILLHHFYTNGRHGPDWSVRRIIEEFSRWAAREVFQNSRE